MSERDATFAAAEFFEKTIRPLLAEHCFQCHSASAKEIKGGLRLDSLEAVLRGGDSGPALLTGKASESLLIQAVEYGDALQMPPSRKLAAAEISNLRRWVELGAPWPGSGAPPPGLPEDASQITRQQRRWWAFQPLQASPPPKVKHRRWPLGGIDQFVLAQLEAHGMQPAVEADRRVWIRRATFDLTGLPPTPAEVDAFENDPVQAYERVVDRLLSSPAYGQRLARHWLDVVRYADYHDGDAQARDPLCEPLQAWRYRDWVVKSFNADLPFDRFIVHQIAGDLLPDPENRDYYADGLIATTFLSNGAWDRGDADKEKMVSDMVDNQIDTIGKAFLGLTLGCARCHDHKFDPITQADYYALAGMFYSTHILKELGAKGGNYTLHRAPLASNCYVQQRAEQLRRMEALNAQLSQLEKANSGPCDEVKSELQKQRDQLQNALLPEPPMAESAAEGGTPGGLFPGIQDVPVHIRGSYTRLGPIIPRRLPIFFAGSDQPRITVGSGRRELADWIASADHRLTARVIVNRVWQWHFGEGLVRTANNIGLLSQPPSHPALLDWLARRFIEDGWSLKKLQRRIMLSAAYRQTSRVPLAQIDLDPENRWLGRFAPRRLEAEAIRDAMLAAAERLEPTAGGPAASDLKTLRRSLYVQTARWDRSSFAMLFDAADPDASTERRNVSITAPQALFLLNNTFVMEQASRIAERIAQSGPQDEVARLERLYRILFARPPLAEEIAICRRMLAASPAQLAWKDLAHMLLCANEFAYLD